MSGRRVFHVVPTERGWSLQMEGRKNSWDFFPTQAEAVQEGIRIAAAQEPGQLIIHKKDGTIQEERTYGEDPRSSRG
jgi:hypothetical protein